MAVDCSRLAELLLDYVSGELPPEELATLEEHVRQCPPCEVHVTTYRLTITLTRKLPPRDMPPDTARRIRELLQRELGGAS